MILIKTLQGAGFVLELTGPPSPGSPWRHDVPTPIPILHWGHVVLSGNVSDYYNWQVLLASGG